MHSLPIYSVEIKCASDCGWMVSLVVSNALNFPQNKVFNAQRSEFVTNQI